MKLFSIFLYRCIFKAMPSSKIDWSSNCPLGCEAKSFKEYPLSYLCKESIQPNQHMRKPNFLVLRVLLGGAARKQQERERDNISNRLQIGNKCTRSVWIFSLPKLPMIGMQESYYYIYIVCTKTKTHNSTFSSLKNQLHERRR